MAYFERTGEHTFRATEHVGGAWDPATQHIASALGLLAHAVETDRDGRRSDGLVIGRLSYDILGTVPVEEVAIDVVVLRPGRTIELVQATLSHGGRGVVVLRAWLMEQRDTSGIAATSYPSLTPPDEMKPWDPTSTWAGGFIASAEVRRESRGPGRGTFWVRTDHELVAGEPVSRLAAVSGLVDIANGMAVRADPATVAFPNVDLTAHYFREPGDGWLGFDTTVSFGPAGLGVTSSVLHDLDGPFGTLNQLLTVRPG